MLKLKPNCECCDKDLPADSRKAVICSFECTFCTTCAEQHLPGGVCPNCKGELVVRITNNTKPILIEAGSFTAVIMPMMVEGSKDPFPEDEAIAISLPEMAMA